MKDTITSFEEWVRQQRKALDITQAQLAARVGCAVVTIKKIEQATRRPSRQMAELLAEALAIPEAQRDAFLRLARRTYVDPGAFPSAVQSALSPDRVSPQPNPGDTTVPATIDVAEKPRRFVARERQMAQLEAHLTGALNGSGRIVFIAGEAGYGKTMLMAAFARHALATYPDLIVAGGNCDAYAGAGSPYLPFREIMALLSGAVESTGRARLLSRDQARRLSGILPQTAQMLVDHGPDLIDVFTSGASLLQRASAHPMVTDSCQAQLGALTQRPTRPGEVRQSKLFEQYIQVLRALADRQPLLLLLDDLQWIDRASADLLLHAARRLAGSRILFLSTYRRSEVETGALSSRTSDEQMHPLTPLHHELKRQYGDIEIDLDQLPPQMGRRFIDALLDSEPNQLAQPFRAALFQRTQGHPLFTVELLQEMQDRGDLVRDSQGNWIEGEAVDWDALPARVEAVISRRISRLPATLQEALKIASIEGETFTAEVIAHILGVDGWRMVQQLSGIAGRQHYLVVGQGSQRLGDQLLSRYRFGHILFQAYLYANLDAAERAYLHEAVGHALEQLAAEQTEAVAVQLAHHFQAAGLTAKAVQYLHQAGRQAMALSAHQEAIAHLTAALALLAELPNSTESVRLELQLQTELGVSFRITKGFAAPEVEMAYLRARVLCAQVGESVSWAWVLWGLHTVYTVRGDLRAGLQAAQECLRLFQGQDSPELRMTGHCTLGYSRSHLGQLSSARSLLEQTLAAYSSQQHHAYIFWTGLDLGVFSLAHLAHVLCYLGYPDQALRRARESLDRAQALAHPFSYAAGLSYLSMIHQLRREWRAMQSVTATAQRLCVEHDIPYYLAWTTFMQGWALTEQANAVPGASKQGIAQMEQSLAGLQAMRAGLRFPYYLGLLAEAHGKVGRVEDGLRLAADGLTQANEQEQFLYKPDLLRVKGELLRMQNAADERPESSFRQAIELAQQQEAKLSELRAATSLARLYQSQGQRREVRQTLASVVDWFSEGGEMVDLQEARALLDALS